MKFMKVCSVVLGILMIAAGIYCILNPDITGLAIGYIIGVSMLVVNANLKMSENAEQNL